MYQCLNCKNLFEEGEEKKYSENMGECFGSPAYEDYYGCPICGSDFKTINPCQICGGYDKVSDSGFCQECRDDVKKRFSEFIDNNFTTEERVLLNELYSGEDI